MFKVDNEFKLILLIEALITTAWSIAPSIVLLNYIINVLGLTLFEVMVVEASISMGGILASILSERAKKEHRFRIMGIGYFLVSLWALIMYFNPSFIILILAYFMARFGEVLAFPFYRSWVFSKIPKEKASSLLSALYSYRKIIAFISPAIAGYLATLKPTLPYLVSLMLFVVIVFVFLILQKMWD